MSNSKQYIIEKTIRTGIVYGSSPQAEAAAKSMAKREDTSYTVYEAVCKTNTIVELLPIG